MPWPKISNIFGAGRPTNFKLGYQPKSSGWLFKFKVTTRRGRGILWRPHCRSHSLFQIQYGISVLCTCLCLFSLLYCVAAHLVRNKLCGRPPPQYASPPESWPLTFWPWKVTWATSVPILVFLGLSVLDLGPMYATDVRRQTRIIA